LWLPCLRGIRLSKGGLVSKEASTTLLALGLCILLLLGPKQRKAGASRRLLLGGLPEYRWLLASVVRGCCVLVRVIVRSMADRLYAPNAPPPNAPPAG